MTSLHAIRNAHKHLKGRIITTPLVEQPLVNRRLGGRLLLKLEGLQITGSFKFRGALHAVGSQRATIASRGNGVVAYSSGNHGQAVAAAAAMHGFDATIVVPDDAPAVKQQGIRAWGAQIQTYPRATGDRVKLASTLAETTGAVLIPPFDDRRIIAGQGTCGYEMAMQLSERDVTPDSVLVPVSGGGLMAGTALAIHHRFPRCAMVAVEPQGYDDLRRSLQAGQRCTVSAKTSSLADALLVPTVGALTWPILQQHVAEALVVHDEALCQAMACLLASFGVVAEPGGAASVAAVLNNPKLIQNKTVVAVVSGCNIDLARFHTLIQNHAPH